MLADSGLRLRSRAVPARLSLATNARDAPADSDRLRRATTMLLRFQLAVTAIVILTLHGCVPAAQATIQPVRTLARRRAGSTRRVAAPAGESGGPSGAMRRG